MSSALVCRTPEVRLLTGTELFESLSTNDKLFAHYAAKAAWLGARIILRQVSPESESIFDFIIQLYNSCDGNWKHLGHSLGIPDDELRRFLEFAATFLSNLGNYYGHGDQRFIPGFTKENFRKLASISKITQDLAAQLEAVIFAPLPETIGLPGSSTQSAYYQSSSGISRQEIDSVGAIAAHMKIDPENTRLFKSESQTGIVVDILQASVEKDIAENVLHDKDGLKVQLVRGDFSDVLQRICENLEKASAHTNDEKKKDYISQLCASFRTGNMEQYKESQRTWVKDHQTTISTVFGFVEPYRDPCGVRAEFEGIVGIEHPGETAMLRRLRDNAGTFIKRLPWVDEDPDEDSFGAFEENMVDGLNFVSVKTIAYCSTLVFPGVNLPNYNDIRAETGSKNIMISNRVDGTPMVGDSTAVILHEGVKGTFMKHRSHTYHLWVVFHELFGHGTGKLLRGAQGEACNFDILHPPISPLSGKPIDTWYKPGETFTGVFKDIATSVDECRAECIGAYLLSEVDLLALCGYPKDGDIKPSDLEYNMYQQLAVAGVRSLENYSVDEKKWGQAHSQGHFAMFQAIRRADPDLIEVNIDAVNNKLHVHVDRSLRNAERGRSALGDLLMRLHIYRCTADVSRCRTLLGELTVPAQECLEWRKILLEEGAVKRVFVQPNTVIVNGEVVINDYEPTVQGLIQSWAERQV